MTPDRGRRPEAEGNAAGGKIGILIVGSDPLVGGLTRLLASNHDLAVLGQASTFADAAPRLADLDPDVVLVEFPLSGGRPEDVGRSVRTVAPRARLVFVADENSDRARFALVEAGAFALVQLSRAEHDLAAAIRRAVDGSGQLTPQTVATILTRHRQIEAQSAQITSREREVLRMLADGVSTREMAARLGVSYTTVRAHVYHLVKKLGAHSRLGAVAKAREQGLI